MIKLAKERQLSPEDFGGLRKYDQVQRKLEIMKKNYSQQKTTNKSLMRAILKTFFGEYFLSFTIGCIITSVNMLSPFLI